MVKTIELAGSEVEVTDLGGQNAAVKNLSAGTIYASTFPNVIAGADNVVEIPAGGGEVVLDARGTVYLLGEGKVQCTGTPYATPNFKMPSSPGGTSGGGGGETGEKGAYCGVTEFVGSNELEISFWLIGGKSMIKTVELTGTELTVEGLNGKNTTIYNKSNGAVYASRSQNITPNADGVMEIPAGGCRGLDDTNGIIYLLGSGKVELTGTDYPVNFKLPSPSGGTSGGGGGETGEKGAYCGVTEFVGSNEGVTSTTIEYSSDFPSKLAEILAAETGWELQADGVTVLKDGGVGFKFTSNYVYLTNDLGSPFDYNFQYISGITSNGIIIDICKSPGGAVAFGCRGINDDGTAREMSLQFVLAQNARGKDMVLAEYTSSQLYVLAKGKSSGDILTLCRLSKSSAFASTTLALLPDDTEGCLLKDVFFLLSYPAVTLPGDSVFIIGGKRFRLLKCDIYSSAPFLAIPI